MIQLMRRMPVTLALIFGGGQAMATGTTKATGGTKERSAADDFAAPVWFHGPVAAAFAQAKKEKKPLLLYWGAIWCPPCNELKAEVFNQPRFAELTKGLVAAHLDGDDADAQIWGEKLRVSGYPTVLLFDADGHETMRLKTAVGFDEFATALAAGIASGGGVARAMDRALKTGATENDWRTLAYFSWDVSDVLAAEPTGGGVKLAKMAMASPAKMVVERAMLAAAALDALANASKDHAKQAGRGSEWEREESALGEGRKLAPRLLDAVFTSRDATRAARSTVFNSADQIVAFVVGPSGEGKEVLAKKWTAAAEQFSDDLTVSIDDRMSSVLPRLSFFSMDAAAKVKSGAAKSVNDVPIPEELKRRVLRAAERADLEAKSAAERTSVISGAAWMLREAREYAAARTMLDKELATTNTPWYYQSSYASLERAAGRDDEALAWANKARLSVKGRASRVQWIVEDLALTARIATPNQTARLTEIVKDYYDTALALPDGFSGRNRPRAHKVAEALKPFLGEPAGKADTAKLAKLVDDYRKRCGDLGEKSAQGAACARHFAALGLNG